MTASLWIGYGACASAIVLVAVTIASPSRPTVPLSRLDPSAAEPATGLAGAAENTAALADRALRRSGRTDQLQAALDRAGMKIRPADLLVITASAAVGAGALGLLSGGALIGLLFAGLVLVVAHLIVSGRRRRRQSVFAGQLDEALQMLSGSLRAGHSVLRAVDAVSRDTDGPVAEEFTRVVNETRVGRDVTEALAEVAQRTASQDFAWVVQAIAIHREVGGNLAEVLDRVGDTIRERSELRREASALSAEGRVSGVVLLVMPIGVVGLLIVVAPSYIGQLLTSSTGIVLIGLAATLMVVGAVWLRKTVQVRF